MDRHQKDVKYIFLTYLYTTLTVSLSNSSTRFYVQGLTGQKLRYPTGFLRSNCFLVQLLQQI